MMKNYYVLFLFLVCSSVASAQEYPQSAIEKNNEAVKLMFHSDSLKKAVLLLDEAIAIDSSYVLAYVNKSQCLDWLGRKSEALKNFLLTEKYALDNSCYYQLKGFYLEKNGDKEAAHVAYQKAFMLFGKELKEKPKVNTCINYIYAKYFCEDKVLTEQEIEALIPSTFSATEKKEVMDFIGMVGFDQVKQGFLTGKSSITFGKK